MFITANGILTDIIDIIDVADSTIVITFKSLRAFSNEPARKNVNSY